MIVLMNALFDVGLRNFDLYYVGKSALIRMALISIKLNKYSLRYYSLKYTHKTRQNFWNNLIVIQDFPLLH